MRGILCINIDSKGASLPVKKKKESGHDVLDLDSDKAQACLREGKVKWYAVVIRTDDHELFRLEKRGSNWIAHHEHGNIVIGKTFKTADLRAVLKTKKPIRKAV